MNRISAKLLSLLAIFLFIAVMPIVVFATNENVSVVSTQNEYGKQEYIIYIKDYTDKNAEFKYAFTNIQNPEEMDLSYINSISDLGENKAAFLDATTYDKLKSNTIYMWAKDNEGNLILEGIQLDLENSLTKEDINTVETVTKRIEVEIATSKDATDSTNPVREEDVEGIKETSKAGYVKITDSKNATYYYQRIEIPSSEEYNRLMELAEEIESEYDAMDMYKKLQIASEFNGLYSKLVAVDDWQEVENMEVKQPESSIQDNGLGNQYIVFLKKVAKNGETTIDTQFLQEYYDYELNTETEKIITQETTKLPITYDSIALIVILAIVVIALVVVFIRMKKLSKKDEEK